MTLAEEGSGRAAYWQPASRTETVGLLLIIAVGALLRLYWLGAQSLWFDEAASVLHARGSFADVIHSVTIGEGSPPLYFLILHWMMAFGQSEVVLRLFSALVGIVALPLLYLFGRALLGSAAGLISAALLAVSPFALYYAQEARPYSLLLTLGIASCYTMLLAVERPSRRRWLGYFLVTLALIYTHYFSFFLIFGQGLVILSQAHYRKTALRNWLLAQLALLLAFLPWLPYMLAQFGWQSARGGQTWHPTVGWLIIPFTFHQFFLGYSAAEIKRVAELLPNAKLLAMSAVGFGLPFAAALSALRKEPRAARWLLLIFGAAFGAALLVDLKVRCYQPTYMAAVMPISVGLLGTGFSALQRRPLLMIVPAVLVTLLTGFSVHNYYHNPRFAREDWRAAAAYVSANAAPQDIIVFHKSWPKAAFDYYYRQGAAEYSLPDQILPADDPLLKKARVTLSQHPTVWLVIAHNFDTDSYYLNLMNNWFDQETTKVIRTCRPIAIYRFVPRAGGQKLSAGHANTGLTGLK